MWRSVWSICVWILGVKGLKILNKQGQSQAKGHSQLWDRADLDTSERLPRPEIKGTHA